MGRASIRGAHSVRDRVQHYYGRIQDEQHYIQVSTSRKRTSRDDLRPALVRERVQQFLIARRGTPR